MLLLVYAVMTVSVEFLSFGSRNGISDWFIEPKHLRNGGSKLPYLPWYMTIKFTEKIKRILYIQYLLLRILIDIIV